MVAQALRDALRGRGGLRLAFGVSGVELDRRRRRHGQDAVAGHVARHREHHAGAVETARDHDRDFIVQRHQRFQHAGHAAKLGEGGQRGLARVDAGLALAVVTQARDLQDAGEQAVGRGAQIGLAADGGVRRDRDALAGDEGLFGDAVLHLSLIHI